MAECNPDPTFQNASLWSSRGNAPTINPGEVIFQNDEDGSISIASAEQLTPGHYAVTLDRTSITGGSFRVGVGGGWTAGFTSPGVSTLELETQAQDQFIRLYGFAPMNGVVASLNVERLPD